MRSFSLVLLRRLLFRTAPQKPNTKGLGLTLYDHLSAQTLTTLERLLLHSLSHEPAQAVQYKSVDTICDLANNSMSRGRPWHALQAQAFTMTQGHDPAMRENAYRVFAGCPNLVMDLQTDAVLGVFQKGLQDSQSIEVSVKSLPHATDSFDSPTGPSCCAPSRRILPHRLRSTTTLSITLPPLPNALYPSKPPKLPVQPR